MDDIDRLFDRTLYFLSFRMRSEKEVRDYLTRKKILPEYIETIVARLYEYKLLDDEEFAKRWIESRQKGKKRGMRLIISELKTKGINQTVIESAVQNLEELQSDDILATQVLEKKGEKYRNLDLQEKKRKLSELLLRRGFSYDIVRVTVDAYLKKE